MVFFLYCHHNTSFTISSMMWFQFIFGERTSVFSLFVLRFSQEWREEFTFHFPLDPEQRCDCWAELSESFIITLGLDFTWNQICSRTTHTHLVTKVRLKSGNKDKKKLFWSNLKFLLDLQEQFQSASTRLWQFPTNATMLRCYVFCKVEEFDGVNTTLLCPNSG